MIGANSPRDRLDIEEALQQREPARGMSWRLTIGDADYSEAIDDGDQVTIEGAEGPALTVTGEISEKLSPELENASVRAYLTAGGVEVLRFAGLMLLPEHSQTTSELGATTASAFVEECEIGEFLEFSNAPPDTVMYEGLTRLPYDLSQVRIDSIPTPLFTRTGADAYSAHDSVSDITSDVTEEAGISWFDSQAGTRAFKTPNLADSIRPVWTFEVNRDIRAEDFRPGRVGDRVRWVVVTRPKTNPLPTEDPVEELARVEIPGSRAPTRTRVLIELSEGAATADAFPRAFLEAARLSIAYTLDFPTIYAHPLLERGDVVAIREPGRDSVGRYVKTWACILGTEGIALPDKTGRYGGPSLMVKLDRLSPTFRRLDEVGRLRRDINILPDYGWDIRLNNWFWVNDGEADYAGADDTGFWIDETLAAPAGVGIDGGGLFFDG